MNGNNNNKRENPFWTIVLKIVDLVGLTSLSVIFCIPLFTAGASVCALYYTIRKNICGERNHVWTCFWHSFKSNFKQATKITLIFLLIGIVLYADVVAIGVLAGNEGAGAGFKVFFYIVMAFIVIYANWVFLYMSNFEDTTKVTMKNAFIISIGNLPTTFLMTLSIAFTVFMAYIFPLSLLIIPGASAWIISVRGERVFDKYM